MYARRPKQSHRDTVSYEIGMLEFCNRRLTETVGPVAEDKALYLEGFLLHYRNLIRFFSGLHHRGDDLSTADSNAWAGRNMTHAEVVAIKDPAIPLDDKYYGSISKYLQHCTRLRHELDRDWDVSTMKTELDPLIGEFIR